MGASRIPKKRTGWIVGTTGLMAAVSLMMILSPALGGAVHSAGIVTVTAPFKGTVTPGDYTGIQGCGKAKLVKPSFFSLATGIGGSAVSGASKSCRTSASSEGYAEGYLTVYLTVPFHKGATTLYVNGSYAATGATTFSAGTCTIVGTPSYASCYRSSDVYTDLYAYFYDLTTGYGYYLGSVYSSNDTYNDTYISGGTQYSSTYGTAGPIAIGGTLAWTYTLSTNMVKSNSYAVEIDTYMEASTECYTYGGYHLSGCSATGSLNEATLGNGLSITSIVET